MEQSTNSGMNTTHVQQDSNGSQYTFLDGIEAYGAAGNLQSNNNDFSEFTWDPALFDGASLGNGFSQPPQPVRSPFDSNATRQSHSPALPQYHATPSSYQSQFQSSLFDSRTLSQPNYDARFYPRPTPSPVSLEPSYPYGQHMTYPHQNYGQPQMNMSMSRQSSAPNLQPNYQPRQQPITPYLSANHGQNSMSQTQAPDLMQYPSFHDPGQSHAHSFVNPSLLNSTHMNNLNGDTTKFQTHQFIPSPYFQQQNSTVDPRSLQSTILPRPIAQAPPQVAPQPQDSSTTNSVPPTTEKPIKIKKPRDPNAPKKPRVKKPKDNLTETQRDGQVSLSDTSDESDSDDEPPEVIPALLAVSQPTDERGKALFNAVQAIWSPRNRPVSAEKVRTGVVAFGDTVRALRDSWKTKNDDLKKAELPKSATALNAPKLKEDVAHYRQVMESVVSRSLHYGHPAIIRSLGENQFIMSALYSFLLDRFNVGDYDSSLVSTILKFAVKFETVDDEMLEVTKWTKILQRFVKKSTNESKSLSQAILTNATAAAARKKAGGAPKSADVATAQVNNGTAVGLNKDAVVGVKRSSDGEPIAPAAKKTQVKPTIQSSKPLALQRLEKQRAAEAQSKVPKLATVAAIAQSAVLPVKSKVAIAAPPKAGVTSTLVTAPKKPGMAAVPRAAPPKEETTATPTASLLANMPRIRKEPVKRESPPRVLPAAPTAKEQSSFLGYLADMEKKEETKPEREEIPNETEEEKKRRLRKEARRRLRVTWRPDNELVETKIFTHFPEEETGQTDSMMRDAGDTGKEGEMLKLHKGMEDLDEDEEDETAVEELEGYCPPSEVDFGELKEDLAGNFTKSGGPLQPESQCSSAQAKHEENTVMAVFASKADRPSTPAEPSDNGEESDFQPIVDFGEPNEKIRDRENEHFARQRQQQQQTYVKSTMGSGLGSSSAGGINLAATLATLQNQASVTQPSGQLSHELRRALGLDGSAGQPPPAQPPSAQAGATSISQLMALVQQAANAARQPQQPVYVPPTPSVQPPIIQSNPSTDLSVLLAQIQSQQQQQPPQPLQYSYQPAGEDFNSRKHTRNDSQDEYYEPGVGIGGGSRTTGGSASTKKKRAVEFNKGDRPSNYKTVPCSFWKEGKCLKGDACTFKHDE